MDCAADTVGKLGVKLGQLILAVHAGVGDISDGGGLHDVPDHELLDGLVLGDALGTVGASHELDVTTSMFVTSVISPLRGHFTLRSESSANEMHFIFIFTIWSFLY